MPPNTAGERDAKRLRKHLSEYLALEVKVGARVSHCRGDAGMTEDLADRAKVDTGFEQMHGGRVAQGVRMDPATICGRSIIRQVLTQKVPDTEPGKRSTVSIPKHHGIGEVGVWWLGRNQFAQ